MTPFELWQRGEGPEPVVVAELPERWRLTYLTIRRHFALRLNETEEQAAAEECRGALARALFPDVDRLALQIANDLFTDVARQSADRLVLTRAGRDLGGWSIGGAIGRIRRHLEEWACEP